MIGKYHSRHIFYSYDKLHKVQLWILVNYAFLQNNLNELKDENYYIYDTVEYINSKYVLFSSI